MLHDQGPLSVRPSELTFESVAQKTSQNPEIQARLRAADIILVPFRPSADYPHEVFPSGVRELLLSLERAGGGIHVEVATEEEAPPELVLHGDILELGKMILISGVAPVVLGVLSNYIWSKLQKGSRDRVSSKVRCELIIMERNGGARSLRYDGHATTFEQMIRSNLLTSGEGKQEVERPDGT